MKNWDRLRYREYIRLLDNSSYLSKETLRKVSQISLSTSWRQSVWHFSMYQGAHGIRL